MVGWGVGARAGTNQHALLGISFEVDKPVNFLAAMAPLEALDLQNMVVRLLDEMEKLALRDLRDFLRTHNIQVDPVLREKALAEILGRTKGEYESTVEALKNVVEELWNQDLGEAATPASDRDKADDCRRCVYSASTARDEVEEANDGTIPIQPGAPRPNRTIDRHGFVARAALHQAGPHISSRCPAFPAERSA